MKTKPVVRVVLRNEKNDILLVKHQSSENWSLPWWHIEAWEDLYQALNREIKEEFDLEIKILWTINNFLVDKIEEFPLPISIYKINYESKIHWKVSKIEYIFNAKIISWKIKVQVEEIKEYRFFSSEEVGNLEDVFEQVKTLIKL